MTFGVTIFQVLSHPCPGKRRVHRLLRRRAAGVERDRTAVWQSRRKLRKSHQSPEEPGVLHHGLPLPHSGKDTSLPPRYLVLSGGWEPERDMKAFWQGRRELRDGRLGLAEP